MSSFNQNSKPYTAEQLGATRRPSLMDNNVIAAASNIMPKQMISILRVKSIYS